MEKLQLSKLTIKNFEYLAKQKEEQQSYHVGYLRVLLQEEAEVYRWILAHAEEKAE